MNRNAADSLDCSSFRGRSCAFSTAPVWLIAALALSFLPAPVSALDPEYSIFQYNTRTWRRTNMLPSSTINAIVQSADSHIWLGTPKGLVDFDGIEFREVGLPGQDESRPQNISSMELRPGGGFWLAVERGGFGFFDGHRYTPKQDAALGGEFPTTRIVHESRDGSLFVALVGSVGRRAPSGMTEMLSSDFDALCLHEDSLGRIWMGTTTHGLLYWKDGRLEKVGGAAAELWNGFVISAVAVDRAGLIWVGASNGLHCLNPDLSPRPATGINSQPKALLIDSHGVLWVGTIADGLYRYKGEAFTSLGRRDGLASDRILALAESSDGSLWVGTEDGLSQLSDVKFPIFSAAEGLAAEACLSVASAPDGGLWAGTSNGLTRIVGDQCTSFGFNRADGFTSEWIKRVFVARNGDVYFLGGRQDINRFRTDRVVKTWHSDTWPQAIAEDDGGIVLAVGEGLQRIENDQLVPYRLADGTELRTGWINELLRTRDGSLWVAAKPGLLQVRDGVVKDWLQDRTETARAFNYLCEDDQGALWAARNTGLVRIKEGRFATVDLRQGLYMDAVYAIVPDQLGNFWIDSPEGIFRVSQQELNAAADGTLARVNCTVFDGAHAIKTVEKTTREYSGCVTREGLVCFPSSKGVIRINPAAVPIDHRPPPTYLQRVLVDGREYPVDRVPSLQAGASNLEFDYSAIDFRAPERIRYRYRLEGYQTDWVDAGGRRAAFFTNLNPGRYRFHVQACNADGVWNTQGASFALTLPRRLHQTAWFRAGAALGLLALIGFAWRIRERRRRREITEMRHREELQLQMIESTPVPMAMLDNRHLILHTNAAFTRTFGYTAAELPDMETWWRLACPDAATATQWAAGWTRRVEAAAALGRSIEPVETSVASKDRTLRHIVVTTSAVGERTLVICSDLTDRKRAEEDRRGFEEQLRQGQKMEAIGRLSGGVAHDFNNLLTVILGNVMLMEMVEQIPKEIAESLREIKGAATRAANLTRQLLAFSRKQPLHPASLDLNHVVREMSRMLQRILGEDIRMDLRLVAGLAPIRADAAMIEQVLLNLAVNARDAMPRGGQLALTTTFVEISPDAVPAILNARAGRFVCLSVSDTGCGIRPEILPRIFEPFFTTKDVGKGTGLGLATAYGIVEQHQGWIDVASGVGTGSTFRVYLPYEFAAALSDTDNPASSEAPPPAAPGRLILVVEDDPGVRALAHKTLSRHGHRVLEAASGPAALIVWKEHRDEIEILLTDVVMPDGMNGLELARQLLAEKPALRVIYASGYSAEVAGGDFSGREGIDFIGKPYDPADLLRIIAHVPPILPTV